MDPEALAPLATLANDSSVYVERAALEALVGVSDVDVARALVKSLNNQDLSKQAAELLVAMKSTALAPLIYGLDGKADNQRQWSAWALGKIKDPDAIEPLIKRLVHRNTKTAAVDEKSEQISCLKRWTNYPLIGAVEPFSNKRLIAWRKKRMRIGKRLWPLELRRYRWR